MDFGPFFNLCLTQTNMTSYLILANSGQINNGRRIISAEMVELVDTLRLERSAVRCAGSSPVLGKS